MGSKKPQPLRASSKSWTYWAWPPTVALLAVCCREVSSKGVVGSGGVSANLGGDELAKRLKALAEGLGLVHLGEVRLVGGQIRHVGEELREVVLHLSEGSVELGGDAKHVVAILGTLPSHRHLGLAQRLCDCLEGLDLGRTLGELRS